MSLRTRVLLGLAVIAVVLVGAAAFVARTTEAYLLAQVDDQLHEAIGPIRQFDVSVRSRPPQPQGDAPQRLSPMYIGVLDATGGLSTVVEPNLDGDAAVVPRIDATQAATSVETGAGFTVGADGASSRYRVLASASPDGSTTVVALPLDDTDAAVRRLLALEVAATLTAFAVLGLVAWWVIRLGVDPVNEMAVTARAIADGDLSHRVPAYAPNTEAGELGAALNRMLGRIEESFDERTRTEQRLRQFVADASHELRTPITTIRGYAELYRVGGLASTEQLDEAMRRTEQEARRMGMLVEDLLQLARLDQGRPLDVVRVDLGALARDAVTDAAAVQPDRPLDVVIEGSVVVDGDTDRLRQVLANLVGNALVHTPSTAAIEVRVRRHGDEVLLEVADQGPGMGPEVAAHVFERFYRADPSRSRQQGGSGLGLAITQAIVEAHSGQVELDTRQGTGTTVRVFLPCAAPVVPPSERSSATSAPVLG